MRHEAFTWGLYNYLCLQAFLPGNTAKAHSPILQLLSFKIIKTNWVWQQSNQEPLSLMKLCEPLDHTTAHGHCKLKIWKL